MSQVSLNQFENLYQVSKTLRFELRPVGKTLENIENNHLLDQDSELADRYQLAKKIIDTYYKHYIEERLKAFSEKEKNKENSNFLSNLETCQELMGQSDESKQNNFKTAQGVMRKMIADEFKSQSKNEHLINDDVIKCLEDMAQKGEPLPMNTLQECKNTIGKFKRFTTYFDGFITNRANMFTEKEQASAIAFRLINDNLPKFIQNMVSFKKVAPVLYSEIAQLESDFASILKGRKLADIFGSVRSYIDFITQSCITDYNTLIGAITQKGNKHIQGLNEYVNLYNQQHKDVPRLPKFVPLYKMILSDQDSKSWLPEKIIDDDDLLTKVQECYQKLDSLFNQDTEERPSLKKLLQNLDSYKLSGIFINKKLSTGVMQAFFDDWNIMRKALGGNYEKLFPIEGKITKKREDDKEKYIKNFNNLSLQRINELTSEYLETEKHIEQYFAKLGANEKEDAPDKGITLFEKAEQAYNQASVLLNSPRSNSRKLMQDDHAIELLKALLDSLKQIQFFIKPLAGNGDESGRDGRFYADYGNIMSEFDQLNTLYDMVRNYLTQKPFSETKYRLYFNTNGKMLTGWTDSRTESDNGTQYFGYLFRKKNVIEEYDYYLGISKNTKLFRKFNTPQPDDISEYERLDYYQLKSQTFYGNSFNSANKYDYDSLKKNLYSFLTEITSQKGNDTLKNAIETERNKTSNSRIETPKGFLNLIKEKDENLYDILLKNEKFLTLNNELIDGIRRTMGNVPIPRVQQFIQKDYVVFTEAMEDVDILCSIKSFEYFHISQSEFDVASSDDNKPLYLFKITNKDLSYADNIHQRKSRGRDNLHTMYFKALMSGEHDVFDIGTGEVFFRRHTDGLLKQKPTHPLGQPIKNKNPKNDKKESTFPYDLQKDKHYTQDKFLFHLSIFLNHKQATKGNINPQANNFIKAGGIQHIIGIDRGERHLLYLSLIDLKGNIVRQFSLNNIVNEYKGRQYATDYHSLLDQKEGDHDKARKNWKTIENIKELKEGYLSQVVHIITQMMVEYKAIIVLENLNGGFINSRKKVEKQVYQKFEKALIDKLNYLVDKQKPINEDGGLLRAYQLASLGDTSTNHGTQSGFLFYIPAWNTSNIDPVTGFCNYIRPHYQNVAKAIVFLKKFQDIRYNAKEDYFEFIVNDKSDFEYTIKGTRLNWTICTYGTRIRTFRNKDKNSKWDNETVQLTDEFKSLFNEFSIGIDANLKEQILQQDNAKFFDQLLALLKLTLQLRNSNPNTGEDYILSPVADENGNFYDSRKYKGEDAQLPIDADANGAYNIARKGLWLIRQIQQSKDNKKTNLTMKYDTWLNFAQQKPYLKD